MPAGESVNFYAGGGFDRAVRRRGDAAWVAARLADPATRILPVWRARNLIAVGPAPAAAALSAAAAAALIAQAGEVALLGVVEAVAYFAIELSHLDEPAAVPLLAAAGEFADLRAVGPLLEHREGALLAYARGLMHWHARHRYCGACGNPTESVEAGHLRRCTDPACALPQFPRTDPAVIVLVSDGARIVLGRQAAWPPGMHSVLAGFVEPGESLEDAVRREVMEEVGVELADVRYHSSQPWPFPASIMLGFTARAATTALRVAQDEIEDARWFSRAELLASPEDDGFRLPRRDSIARRLIEDWLAEGG